MNLYLAGGCFWGVQHYIKQINGVTSSSCGYANSIIENPTYEQVCSHTTKAVECVKITFDEKQTSLETILRAFFNIINPCSVNKQGEDEGSQYRSGIYVDVENQNLLVNIEKYIENNVQPNYNQKVVTEVLVIENYYLAEQYHQNYLDKNPNGYCHINVEEALKEFKKYNK